MNPLLNIEDLSISFSQKLFLKSLHLRVNKGECIGIVGESGSGKSLTAQAIMGLLNHSAQIVSGKICFEGENLLEKNEKQLRQIRGKKIGIIFQDPFTSLNPTMKVGKQIMEVILQHEKMHRSVAREFTFALLQQVKIPEDYFHAYPFQLSGGMRQRIMIAIAIACRPKLIIADEATTALDATIQFEILELLRTLQKTYEMAILLITHDMGIAAKMCDRITVLKKGEVIEEGDQVFSHPTNIYTKQLLEAVLCLSP